MNVSLPRYLYVPLGIQLALEVIARFTLESLRIGFGLMIVSLSLCIYVGVRGVLTGRPVFYAALWTFPLTLLTFINGSLGFAFSAPGYDHTAYLGFVFASILFCIAGIAAGLVGGVAARMVGRAKRTAT